MKSSGERMPIVAMLSKDASAKGYDTLLYVNNQLLESSRDSLGFIIRSFGDVDALRTSYPVIMDTVMGLDSNKDMSLDDRSRTRPLSLMNSMSSIAGVRVSGICCRTPPPIRAVDSYAARRLCV